jgi:microsomal epoxide hydrolase
MYRLRPRRHGLLAALQWGALLCAAPWRAAARQLLNAAGTVDATSDLLSRREVRTSDGVLLNLLERKPATLEAGSAPVVALLPGWCMPAAIWREQLLGLGERWHTVAIDPRGQGESQIPVAGYTADRRADDLHDVLQDIGSQRVVLVAWSLGVLEALQYVQRHGSSRLLALVLVDNSIGEPPLPLGGGAFLRELRHERAGAIDRFVRGMFARPPAESLIEQVRASALRMPLDASIALLSYPLPREHWRELVHAFDRPLAYLITPRYREQSEHLRQARPRAMVEIFEHAGHALFVDEAQRFNRLLSTWIEGLTSNAPGP